VSAPAHTQTPSDESVAVAGRFVSVLDRALPFLGPALAGVLGFAALGRRALVLDEASLLAAVQGSFSDVVDRAISDDPARAGYLALLQPIASHGDSELWLRLPSVIAGMVAAAAVYVLGRRLAGRHAGAVASLVLASSVGVLSLTRAVGPLVELPNTHPLYSVFFKFPDGPPTTSHELNGWGDNLVHKHLLAVEREVRIGVLYSSKDYSSEWNYHPSSKRFLSIDNTRFAVNIIVYALTS